MIGRILNLAISVVALRFRLLDAAFAALGDRLIPPIPPERWLAKLADAAWKVLKAVFVVFMLFLGLLWMRDRLRDNLGWNLNESSLFILVLALCGVIGYIWAAQEGYLRSLTDSWAAKVGIWLFLSAVVWMLALMFTGTVIEPLMIERPPGRGELSNVQQQEFQRQAAEWRANALDAAELYKRYVSWAPETPPRSAEGSDDLC